MGDGSGETAERWMCGAFGWSDPVTPLLVPSCDCLARLGTRPQPRLCPSDLDLYAYRLLVAFASPFCFDDGPCGTADSRLGSGSFVGTVTLDSGFARSVRPRGGPGGAVANPILGEGCVGYLSNAPHVVFDYRTQGGYDLTFSATSDD